MSISFLKVLLNKIKQAFLKYYTVYDLNRRRSIESIKGISKSFIVEPSLLILVLLELFYYHIGRGSVHLFLLKELVQLIKA
jgi:hypothetical protein